MMTVMGFGMSTVTVSSPAICSKKTVSPALLRLSPAVVSPCERCYATAALPVTSFTSPGPSVPVSANRTVRSASAIRYSSIVIAAAPVFWTSIHSSALES